MSSMIGMSPYTGQSSKVSGTGYRSVTMPTKSPEQMNLIKQLLGGISPGLSGGLSNLSQMAAGGSPEFWEQTEAPAMRQFNELLGQLSSRFSGMGLGARKSSGFNLASQGAATDLAERLQGNRASMQQQAIRDLLGLGQNLLSQDLFDTHLIPKKKPFWQELLGSTAGGIGSLGGTFGGLGLAKLAGF